MRSSITYWASQRVPNTVTLAARAARARPVNDRAQKGATSARSDLGPRLRQTQRRLSSKEGTVPTPVAMTLAQPAVAVSVATSTPRTVRLVAVEMADTVA